MSEFPSPIGVLYISIKKDELIEAILKAVSVPYWGSLYFNLYLIICMTGLRMVSVPYWGSLYFIWIINAERVNLISFPSPIGILYISMHSTEVSR